MQNGVNILAWPDMATRYKDEYFDWIKNWNLNTILLNFGWNFLEPTKGVYDEAYLQAMDTFIAKAKSRGLYVILRMHKWNYPWGYQADYPPWPESWIIGYPTWIGTTPGFWENVEDCQQRYVEMWRMLASRYRNEPYVTGFDLFGEPALDMGDQYGDGATWDTWNSNACRKANSVLYAPTRLYKQTIDTIHSVSPQKTVIFEPAMSFRIIMEPGGPRVLVEKPNCPNITVGRSIYQFWEWPWLDEELNALAKWNIPYLVVEFGVKSSVVSSPDPSDVAWVEEACQRFKDRNLGWMYWNFGPGTNDFNLVDTDDSISPIATEILSKYGTGLLPAPTPPILATVGGIVIGGGIGYALNRKKPIVPIIVGAVAGGTVGFIIDRTIRS